MTSVTIFAVSGIMIILLTVAKGLSGRRGKNFFILRAISRGDTYARRVYHLVIHFYSESRDRILFFLQKQIRMHMRNSWNKMLAFVHNRRDRYLNQMRDSKLLKKQEGISDFLRNISDIDRGNGEIHDSYGDGSQDTEKDVR